MTKPSAESPAKPPVRVFVSYARDDEHHLLRFRKYSADLARDGVEIRTDRDIPTGEDWKRALLDDYLGKADIVVLLVTPSFLHSAFCMEVELPQAMKRREAGECEIFPVKVEPCLIAKGSPLRTLQWTPSGGTVMGDSPFHEAQKWRDVAKELSRSVDRVRRVERSPGAQQGKDVHGLRWWAPSLAIVAALALVIMWRIPGSPFSPSTPEVRQIVNRAAGGSRCISYFHEPNQVLMGDCSVTKPDWVLRRFDDGYAKFESDVKPGICLGVRTSTNIVGSWSCGDGFNATWRLDRKPDGYFQLRSRYAEDEGSEEKCLTYIAEQRDGVPLRLKRCDGRDVQQWKMTEP
ncbi:TIR domain-containing protein [Streptomyces sp. NPDC000151]|uniref:TIR domain-containing protein n=1 Tax=Streptomyces sp. NPDC000151 TaxID=3154244 RepID=UPI003321BFFC